MTKKITIKRIVNAVLSRIPFVAALRTKHQYNKTLQQWSLFIQSATAKPASQCFDRLLIIPSEPYTLIGSRGDHAMMTAIIDKARLKNPNIKIALLTATNGADAAAHKMGCVPLRVWQDRINPERLYADLKSYAPDAVALLGADAMDGYYTSYGTLSYLIIGDVCARLGARVAFIGFSFNAAPAPELKAAFQQMHPAVSFNLRDAISNRRFKEFTSRDTHQVADAAFCLKPDVQSAEYKSVSHWARQQREAGNLVLGFNLHPMLIKHASAQQIKALVDGIVNVISGVSQHKKISWLLVPHDFRDKVADNVCLDAIAQQLQGRSLKNALQVTGQPTAATLKAMVGLTDGLVTGRMHLAIAALGMGVPVLALTYQDKFQGLFDYFDLPEWLLVSPNAAFETQGLIAKIE
ncbi:MAG: polysaccharide pyruvyl transferase family protein [Alphaproteobacteria bacterium]|nr:polysaccharide pyruvyl transferase family protein [Alphaproteobacteria bacterium]